MRQSYYTLLFLLVFFLFSLPRLLSVHSSRQRWNFNFNCVLRLFFGPFLILLISGNLISLLGTRNVISSNQTFLLHSLLTSPVLGLVTPALYLKHHLMMSIGRSWFYALLKIQFNFIYDSYSYIFLNFSLLLKTLYNTSSIKGIC